MLTNINSQTERVFKETKALWRSILNNNSIDENIDIEFIKNIPLFDIVDTTNSTIAIYNYQKFHPEYISENVNDIMGFTSQQLLTGGSKFFYSRLINKSIDFPLNLAKLSQSVFKDKNYSDDSNVLATLCGLTFAHPTKGTIRVVMQQYFIENDAQNLPIRVIATMQDVSHLLKDDFYFIRILYGNKHQYVKAYHQNDKESAHIDDILTVREKEILRLLAQYKENEEIATALGISINTVRNHRQNILDRLGVKDTTSLLELGRICHMV